MAFVDLLARQCQNATSAIIPILRRFCNAFLLGFKFRIPQFFGLSVLKIIVYLLGIMFRSGCDVR